MRQLTDQQVELIARELAAKVGTGTSCAVNDPGGAREGPPGVSANVVLPAPGNAPGEGVFDTVDACIDAAREAFVNLGSASLSKRDEIIAAIRETMRLHGDPLAKLAWEETGLGRYEDKILKNRLVTKKTSGTEVLTPHAVTGDNGLTLTEYAPYGVIGAITPTTNPTSTIICNTIAMVSAGNSIVFNVHPNARACSMANVRLLHRAIIKGGGPANLVTTVAQPTIESAQELMGRFIGRRQLGQDCGVDCRVSTGENTGVQFVPTGGDHAGIAHLFTREGFQGNVTSLPRNIEVSTHFIDAACIRCGGWVDDECVYHRGWTSCCTVYHM